MLIGLCSLKGSPGVTTTAVALATRWPGTKPILIEADPAGGDLGPRFGLPSLPGLGSLAAAARRSDDPAQLAEHCQVLPGGPPVVVGPVGAEQARATLAVLSGRGAELLRAVAADPDVVVLLDAGRVEPSSPAVMLLRGASAVLVLTRPQVEDLSHVASVLSVVPTWTRCPGLVLVGGGYSRAEVERELGVPVLASLPDDPRGADALCGRLGARGADRSALGQAAARLADQILTQLHDPAGGHHGVPPAPRAGDAADPGPAPRDSRAGTPSADAPARTAVDRTAAVVRRVVRRRPDVADTGSASEGAL
jgi:hypothetical protein